MSEFELNAAEARAESVLIGLEMDVADMKRRWRARELCPPGWRSVDKDHPTQPRKVKLSLRIDKDVAGWFWQQGAGYQTRMNAVLRAHMEAKRADLV